MGRSSSSSPPPAEKVCASCGRRIEWRKKWERDWEQVKYCSSGCRRHGVDDTDSALEKAILTLLAARKVGATICPSEAARAVSAEGSPRSATTGEEDWRTLMEPARRAARRLVAAGEVEITQGGRVVDPSTARGAIRVRRATRLS
ncbi:MAG: DUF2256 and DUF3253 domain-containing protein [Ornithinimicrobium sp.]